MPKPKSPAFSGPQTTPPRASINRLARTVHVYGILDMPFSLLAPSLLVLQQWDHASLKN